MDMDLKEIDTRLSDWQKRLDRRKAEEADAEALTAEKLQQAYLQRTGRAEVKP